MNQLKIIKTEQDHQQALTRLMALMDLDPNENSAEQDEMDVLAVLIEKYEQETFPIAKPDPIAAIKFRMEQQGLTNKDLVPYMGAASKVSEVLNGKRPLSLNMVRKLSTGLGISADVLIQAPELTAANDLDIEWSNFPLAEMRKRGYFEDFTGKLSELKEYAAEHLNNFFSSVPSGSQLKPALLRSSAHLRSNDKETDAYAVLAWQVRVLQKAQEEQLPANYIAGSVNLAWMQKLARMSWSSQGPALAKEYLNKHGIHLIIEPHLPKTYLDGAVCLKCNGNPVIALTLRHDRVDSFWFTLMHELAHIALHLDGSTSWYLDDLEVTHNDTAEQEADALASEALLPVEIWQSAALTSAEDVKQLAKLLEISPCIIAGRLRHESTEHTKFGTLFREKVRHLFTK
jgi:HTH-type transcriptional regulator / antitoxin HigA